VEHRYGHRTPIDVPVRLKAWPRIGRGKLRDASVSGAFIETDLELPLFGMVDLEIRGIRTGNRNSRTVETHVIPACIVRSDRSGIGVEWFEFAPAAISALIADRAAAGVAKFEPRTERASGRLQQAGRDVAEARQTGTHR
jgi:hypothetical protein